MKQTKEILQGMEEFVEGKRCPVCSNPKTPSADYCMECLEYKAAAEKRRKQEARRKAFDSPNERWGHTRIQPC